MDNSHSCNMECEPETLGVGTISHTNSHLTETHSDPDTSDLAMKESQTDNNNTAEPAEILSKVTSVEEEKKTETNSDNLTETADIVHKLETIESGPSIEQKDINENSNFESSTVATNENDEDSYESDSDSSCDESTDNEGLEDKSIIQERLKELEKYCNLAQFQDSGVNSSSNNLCTDFHQNYKSDSNSQNSQTTSTLTNSHSETNQNPLGPNEVKTSDADSSGLDDVLNKYHSSNGLMDNYQNPTMDQRFYAQQSHPHYYSSEGVNMSHPTSMASNAKYIPYDYYNSGSNSTNCMDFQCQECGQVFDKKSLLKAHLKTVHMHMEDKKFKCSQCQYASHYQKNLEKHVETFHNENGPLFHCDLCSKKFTNELHFNEHKSYHTVDNTHACHHCGKQFKTKLKLKYHMDVHNPKKQYKCDYVGCDRAFSTPKYLNNHRNEFHGLQPKQLECPMENCGEVFQRKSHLNRHMSVHGENCFRCTFPGCNRSFRNQETLQHHQFKHSGQKPFRCDLCDFSCRQRSVLNNHYRDSHSKDNYPLPSPIYKQTGPCTPDDVRSLQRSISMPVSSGLLSPCKTPSGMRCHTGDVYAFTEFDSHSSIASRYHTLHNDKDLSYRSVSQGAQILKMRIDGILEDVLMRKHYNFFETEPLSEEQILLAESILENTVRMSSENKNPQGGNSVPNQMKDIHSDYPNDFKMEDIASLSQFDDVFAEVAPEVFNFSEGRDFDTCGNSRSPSSCAYFPERIGHLDGSDELSKSNMSRNSLPRLGNIMEENLPFNSDYDSENKNNIRISSQSRDSDCANMGICSVSSDNAMRVTPRSTHDNVDLLDEVLQDLRELEEKQKKETNISPDNLSISAQSNVNGCPPDSSNGQIMTSTSSSNSCTLNGLTATPVNTTPESQWSDSDYSFGRDSVGVGSNAQGPPTSSVATPSNQSSVGSSDSQYHSAYNTSSTNQFYSPVKSGVMPNSFPNYDPNSHLARQVSYPGESVRQSNVNQFNRQMSSSDHLRSLAAIGQNPYASGSGGPPYDRSNQQNIHSWQNGCHSHSNVYPNIVMESPALNRQMSGGSYPSQSVQTATQEFVSPTGAPPQNYPPGPADYVNSGRPPTMLHGLQRHNGMVSQNKLDGYPGPDYHSITASANMMNPAGSSNFESLYPGMYLSQNSNGYAQNRMPQHMDNNFSSKQLPPGYRPYMFDGKSGMCPTSQMQPGYPQPVRYTQPGYMLPGNGSGPPPSTVNYPGPGNSANPQPGFINEAAVYRSQMVTAQGTSAGGPPFNPVQGRYAFPNRY